MATNKNCAKRERIRNVLLARYEMRAAVLRPRTLVVTVVERTLFAVAHRADTRCVHTECHQVFLGRVGALLAECQVVRRGAALVAAVSYTHLRAHETPEHLVCR